MTLSLYSAGGYPYIVTLTGGAGSGSLQVGFGDSVEEAIDNLSSTPYGAHEDETTAVQWAAQEDDLALEDELDWEDEIRGESFSAENLQLLQDHGPDLLRPRADLSHESAEDWFDSFGWHVSSENHGDFTLQDVSLEALLEGDVDEILAEMPDPRDDEDEDNLRDVAIALSDRAQEVFSIAEAVETALDDAVSSYESNDVAATMGALSEAHRTESEGGDTPATNELAKQLLTPVGLLIFNQSR